MNFLLNVENFIYNCMDRIADLAGKADHWIKRRKFLYLLDKLTEKKFMDDLSEEIYDLEAYSDGTEGEYDDEITDRLLAALEALKGRYRA